jgi:hypothetical protein
MFLLEWAARFRGAGVEKMRDALLGRRDLSAHFALDTIWMRQKDVVFGFVFGVAVRYGGRPGFLPAATELFNAQRLVME